MDACKKTIVHDLNETFDGRFAQLEETLCRKEVRNRNEGGNVRLDRPPSAPDAAAKFNKLSCEDQFKFNQQLGEKLHVAEQLLDQNGVNDAGLDALAVVKEGQSLISQRQKLVRLADSSDSGWRTVREQNQTHSPMILTTTGRSSEPRIEPPIK